MEGVDPFVCSHPVDPEDIIDRDAETQMLLRNVIGGHIVRLSAPRRFGKTSLLRRVVDDGERMCASPQTFSLGKRCLSMSTTSWPARASSPAPGSTRTSVKT